VSAITWPASRADAVAGQGMKMTGEAASGTVLKLLLAWGFVAIPRDWGLVETRINAAKRFG
jgi:hypothetical protein